MSQAGSSRSSATGLPPAEIQIRKAELRDYPALAGLYWEVRRATFSWVPAETFQLEDFYRDTQGELIWLVEAGQQVVGFASVYLQSAFLHSLYIAEAAQGQGIGSALLGHVVRTTRGRMTLKCLTFNRLAQAFYLAHGWTVIGSGESAHGPYLTFEAPALS